MAGMMTTRELQELLQVDRSTIYRMAEAGRIPAVKVGKQWRFPEEMITAWLKLRVSPTDEEPVVQDAATTRTFEQLIPVGCAQALLDVFAEALSVSLLVTDLKGMPLTAPSNPIPLFRLLDETELGHSICRAKWRHLALDPQQEPRFSPGFGGLLCARALVRPDGDSKAMVVVFGIAPDDWPPSENVVQDMALRMKMPASKVKPALKHVPQLSADERRRTLLALQGIADALTMIAQERCGLLDRLSGIAKLSAF